MKSAALRWATVLAAVPVLTVLPALTLVILPHAVEITSFSPGPGAGSADSALGAPQGGSLYSQGTDAVSLGVGGVLTLELGSPARDGPGTDLVVCENAFYKFGTLEVYGEVAYVEVSTDGVSFARFPTRYSGVSAPIGAFGTLAPWSFSGFTGAMPVTPAEVYPPESPWDVAAAGGDAFDLADLADHPLVLSSDVLLHEIRYVRLVDIVAGSSQDSFGAVIFDSGDPAFSSAEIDGVVAVNHFDNLSGSRPEVEMELVNGVLSIALHDADGFIDFKHGITASVNGFPFSFWSLFPFFTLTEVSPSGFTIATPAAIPPGMFACVIKVSAVDDSGLRGGDGVVIP
ncbi:MAG: hypothetical protein ACT4PU_05630 [Planctomycetota bacterium]